MKIINIITTMLRMLNAHYLLVPIIVEDQEDRVQMEIHKIAMNTLKVVLMHKMIISTQLMKACSLYLKYSTISTIIKTKKQLIAGDSLMKAMKTVRLEVRTSWDWPPITLTQLMKRPHICTSQTRKHRKIMSASTTRSIMPHAKRDKPFSTSERVSHTTPRGTTQCASPRVPVLNTWL